MHCITSNSIAMIVNGTATPYFSPSRRIRQGDPMSPYIFILCMKMFSRLISYQVDTLNWDSITISNKGPHLSHLFFVDDLTLTSKVNMKSCTTIKNTLDFFCTHSGQKVNLDKSKIYFSPNCPEDITSTIINNLGIKVTKDFGNT